MRKLLIILLIFFSSIFTCEGAKKYIFSNLSLKDGLSQLSILSIYQDSDGYMWFGTRNGLNRYDGYSFDVFLNKPKDSNSLSNNHILAIIEDKNGFLWVGTNEGLNRLDLSTHSIKRYLHDPSNPNSLSHNMVASLYIDREGDLWIGTDSGLNLYKEETDDFELYNPDKIFSNNPINAISGTKENQIVLGTMYQGLVILNKIQKKRTYTNHKHEENNPASLSENGIRSVFVDNNNNIWVGTLHNGLNLLKSEPNKTSTGFTHFTLHNGLSSNFIRGITESPSGEIIVGTSNGLNIINPLDYQIETYNTYGTNRGELSHYSVFPVYFDKSQTLWVGTYAGGVNYVNPYGNKFRNYDIDSELNTITGIAGPMVETSTDIYIATEGGGLICFNKAKETFKQYRLGKEDEQSYLNNIIKCLYIDGNDILCGTTVGTVYRFNPRTERFSLLYEFEEKNSVYVIQRDSKGNLILGGVNRIGLMLITTSGKEQKVFPLADSKEIAFTNVRSFLEPEPGIYLIGTRNEGLFLYDSNRKTYKQYKKTENESWSRLPENFISYLTKDSQGNIWVGTFGGGFCLFDMSKETFTVFDTEAGLLNNSICAIVESNNKHLLISTIEGISYFDPIKKTFQHYTKQNGINIREFSLQSGIKSKNGTLFFGGNNGIVSFNPAYLDINPFIPPVVMENLYINNEVVVPAYSTILNTVLNKTNAISLKYNQSNISIEYSALNYIFPERNQYAYILEGFDEKWNYVDNRRVAYYTNIPPGEYIFRVKASNNDGVWNETGATLQITILPPFWKTWWAYSLYILCFITIIYLIIRHFKERERLKNSIKLKQVEAKTQAEFHETRNRLFTNFSHELRTPLTLILSPLDEIIEYENLHPKLRNRMQMMQSNSHRLLRLVNNLMDFQKNESGMLKPKVSKSDFVIFAKEMTLLFKEMALNRHIELSFESDSDTLFCLFDKNLMEKVFFNFLSNALKNTANQGKVFVRLMQIENSSSLLVEISDTGIGISKEDIEKIFMPFYQVSQSEYAHSGTGLGLSLSKSIIELHHGKVWAESDGKTGSSFKFVLPLQETLFANDKLVEDVENRNNLQYTIDTTDEIESEEEIISETKYTILIVEDNPDVRNYIKSRLENTYKILEATNGKEGLTKAFSHLPDLILTDLMMPGMNGIEMCLKLKNDIHTSHIPVIIITARSTPSNIFEGYETGADDYIVKPFNISLLKVRIRNILQSREKLKEIYGKNFSLKPLGIEAKSLDEKFMQQLYELVEREIANPDLDIQDFCQELGLSRSNLYRKIKAVTNLTLGEFIRNFRLEMATKLLQQEGLNVSDVFAAVGFSSHSYFSNCFKAAYGVSPSEYVKIKEK